MINVKHLEAMTGSNRQLLKQLITEFMETTTVDMQSLQEAILQKNPSLIFHFSHRIKGAAALMGIKPMADLARSLEQTSQQALDSTINARFQQLKTFFDDVSSELKQEQWSNGAH